MALMLTFFYVDALSMFGQDFGCCVKDAWSEGVYKGERGRSASDGVFGERV